MLNLGIADGTAGLQSLQALASMDRNAAGGRITCQCPSRLGARTASVTVGLLRLNSFSLCSFGDEGRCLGHLHSKAKGDGPLAYRDY